MPSDVVGVLIGELQPVWLQRRREHERLLHPALVHALHNAVGGPVRVGPGRVGVDVDDRQPVVCDAEALGAGHAARSTTLAGPAGITMLSLSQRAPRGGSGEGPLSLRWRAWRTTR